MDPLPRPSSVSVLIVEHDTSVANSLEAALSTLGFATVRTSSAADALELLADMPGSSRPQLVLCNIALGEGMGGIDCLIALRHALRNEAAIVMVSHVPPEPAMMELCFVHDADTFATLPLLPAQLRNLTVFVKRRQRSAQIAAARAAGLRQTLLGVESQLKKLLSTSPPTSTEGPSSSYGGHVASIGGLECLQLSRRTGRRGSAPAVHAIREGSTRERSLLKRGDTVPLQHESNLRSPKTVTFANAESAALEKATALLMPLLAETSRQEAAAAARTPAGRALRKGASGNLRQMMLQAQKSSTELDTRPAPTDQRPAHGIVQGLGSAADGGASGGQPCGAEHSAYAEVPGEADMPHGPAASSALPADPVPAVLCRLCETRVAEAELGRHLELCQAGLTLRQAQDEINGELRALVERIEVSASTRLRAVLLESLNKAKVQTESLIELKRIAVEARDENATSKDMIIYHIGALSQLFERTLGRSGFGCHAGSGAENDPEHSYFSIELQSLLSEKTTAVKAMLEVCPHALDVCLPPSLVGVPSLADFDLLRRVAKGGFGSVWVARKRSSGDVFALKVMRRGVQRRMQHVEDIIFRQHTSEHLVRGFFTFRSACHVLFVLEYMPGGDLRTMLDSLGMIDESTAQFYFAEAILGLRYLHDEGVLHHDIKPSNMLISATGHLKLTDFGLSLAWKRRKAAGTHRGTLPYMAPEVVRGDVGGFALDMWSCGVVLYELLVGELPMPFTDPDTTASQMLALIEKCTGGVAWRPARTADKLGISPAALDLCCSLIVMDPAARPDCAAVQRHAFFDGALWSDREMLIPPFIPTLDGDDDVSYFERTEGFQPAFIAAVLSDEDSDTEAEDGSFKGGVHTDHLVRLSLSEVSQRSSSSTLLESEVRTVSSSDDNEASGCQRGGVLSADP